MERERRRQNQSTSSGETDGWRDRQLERHAGRHAERRTGQAETSDGAAGSRRRWKGASDGRSRGGMWIAVQRFDKRCGN